MPPSNRRHPLIQRFLDHPTGVVVTTFATLVFIGAGVLSLPVCQSDGPLSTIDLLFTATSAVCVTGLAVADTSNDFSRTGQAVILVLFQLGGLGIMTLAAFALQVAGRRLSLRDQATINDVFFQRHASAALHSSLLWIVLSTLAIEVVGAISLLIAMPRVGEPEEMVFIAAFHAVSAFCNAGFSLNSDSLVGMRDNTLFMVTIGVLIILGGLGYTVLAEMVQRPARKILQQKQARHRTLHTRVVLTMTVVLIVAGAVILRGLGLGRAEGSSLDTVGDALFQSITARTAGFNSIDLAAASTPVLLVMILLMFIGGSPGSCAGGVKTTSVAVWLGRLWSRMRQREDVVLGGRTIPTALVRRTGVLLGISLMWVLIGIMILSMTEMGREGVLFEALIFEQVSAFATVGLSTGMTPDLTAVGKAWIILSMFVGRLGPLTIMLVFIEKKSNNVRLPEERIMIG